MCNMGSRGQHTGSHMVCTSNYARSGAYCAEDRTVSSGALWDESPTLTLLCNAKFSVYILYLRGYPDSSSLTSSFLAGTPKVKAAFGLGSSYSQSRGTRASGRQLCSSVGWVIAGRLLSLFLHWLGKEPQAGLASLQCACPNQPALPLLVGWEETL